MTFSARPALPSDAPTIARHRYPAEADAPERPAYADWVRGAIERATYTGLLAEGGGEVVSGAGLVWLDWGPSRGNAGPLRARLVNVWKHEKCRRRGLARRLVQGLLADAKARGIGIVSLSSTEMGRSLYESLGFAAYPHEMLLKMIPAP